MSGIGIKLILSDFWYEIVDQTRVPIMTKNMPGQVR